MTKNEFILQIFLLGWTKLSPDIVSNTIVYHNKKGMRILCHSDTHLEKRVSLFCDKKRWHNFNTFEDCIQRLIKDD